MGQLYLIPSPIGNLEDITLRAIRILKEVDLILAEDKRTTGFLLKHHNIQYKKMSAYHMHNEHATVSEIVNQILAGDNVALVTDAGTPGISDPGFLIVQECIRHGIVVECLPGATALIPALVNSGFPTDRFCFEGFLPAKKGKQTRLLQLQEETRTMIFYESPYRLVKTLQQLSDLFEPERKASVSRELSKFFEENKRGTLAELIEYFSAKTVKGEIVIVVAGKEDE